jgi:hypothetical protein
MNAPFTIKTNPVSSLTPAAIAIGPAKLDRRFDPERVRPSPIAKDRSPDMILRTTCAPTSSATPTQLAHLVVTFLETLVPVGAGADLLARGIGLNFSGAAQNSIQGIAVPTADGADAAGNDRNAASASPRRRRHATRGPGAGVSIRIGGCATPRRKSERPRR